MKFKSLKFAPIPLNSRRVTFLAMENIGALNETDFSLIDCFRELNYSINELEGEGDKKPVVMFSGDYGFYFDEK